MPSSYSSCTHTSCEGNDPALKTVERPSGPPSGKPDGYAANSREPSGDYYSTWIEVDVQGDTTSGSIIKYLENHFTCRGIQRHYRRTMGQTWSEECLDELGIKHKKTIPLWPRESEEVEQQNK